MNQLDPKETTGPESLLAAWIKSVTDFWSSVVKTGPGDTGATEDSASAPKAEPVIPEELWQSTLKTWQTFLSTMISEPESLDATLRGAKALPEIFLKMTQGAWDGYYHLQRQWWEKAKNMKFTAESPHFTFLDQETFRAWTETYEKEFRQFLNIPQLGLTRFYQERMSQMVDKLNLLQGAMSEFLYLNYLPIQKTIRVMEENLVEILKKGRLPENFKDYYNMWIRILEGHYLALLRSPEYSEALSKTLRVMEDFSRAKEELLGDILRGLSIPTQKELDELYKEIYLLKKQLKKMEKKLEG